MSIDRMEFVHSLLDNKEFEKAIEMVNLMLESELEYEYIVYLKNLKIYISLMAY